MFKTNGKYYAVLITTTVFTIAGALLTSGLLTNNSEYMNAGGNPPQNNIINKEEKLKVLLSEGNSDPITSLNWDIIQPGIAVTKIMYLKNLNNKTINVVLNCTNWVPEGILKYITVFYNKKVILSPNSITPYQITLIVSDDITGISDFSFDVLIESED
jgi:hypothetical protein